MFCQLSMKEILGLDYSIIISGLQLGPIIYKAYM